MKRKLFKLNPYKYSDGCRMTVLMSIMLEKCLQCIKHLNCAAVLLIGSMHQEKVAQEKYG